MNDTIVKFARPKPPKMRLTIEIESMTFMGLHLGARGRKRVSGKELTLADIEEQAGIDLDEIWRLKDEDGNPINEDD